MRTSIVIIDDDEDDLILIKEGAELVNFADTVIAFNKPHAAIEHILKFGEKVRLIIADVNMPKLNGFEVRRTLLYAGKPYTDIPFVFLSTSRSGAGVDKAAELLVTNYYVKPDTLSAFRDILSEIKNKNNL